MRRLAVLTALVLLASGVLPSGEARAAGTLSGECGAWFGQFVLALVCDPAQRGGERLAIHARGETVTGKLGVAQLGGSEPFSEGESVELDLTGGGPGTTAALLVVTQGRTLPMVVAPFTAARRYTVTVTATGLTVRSQDGVTRDLPFPPARSVPGPLRSATPAEAVTTFVRLMGGGDADRVAACELLSADARDALTQDEWGCDSILAAYLYGGEGDDPSYAGRTSVGAIRVVRHGGLTIARVRVRHHFEPERGQPRSASATANVPMVHEAGGWRLAIPFTLLPNAALGGDADARAGVLRRLVAEVARAARVQRERQARKAALTTPVGAAEPCAGTLAEGTDPAGDVVLASGRDRVRRQELVHVDVLAIRHARAPVPCFELQTATPLPERFGVELRVMAPSESMGVAHDDLAVTIADGRAVGADRDIEDDELTPVRVAVGISADRRTLTLRPDPQGLWDTIPLARPYRWAATLFEEDPVRGVTYMEEAPTVENIEPGVGFLAPPA